MFDTDREIGKAVLIIVTSLFIYYTIWVIGLPFINDNRLQSLFPPQSYALFVPAFFELFVLGGLALFTLYHLATVRFSD